MLHKELPVNLIVDVLASEVTMNLLLPKGNTVLDHDDAHLLSKTTGSAGTTLILIDRQDAEDVTKEREKKRRKNKNKSESSEAEVVHRENAALLQRWCNVGASLSFRDTITTCCIVDGVMVVLALVVLLMVRTSAVTDNVVVFITGSGAKSSAFPPVPHFNGVTNQNEEVRQRLIDKLTSTATYNDIKASPVNAAIVGFILILVPALVLVHEHVFNVLHVRSHAKHVLNLLKKIKRNNAVAVKLNLTSQERISSQEHGTVKRWNVNNGSVRSTNNGRRFAAAAGHWYYYFIGFLLLATAHFANASFTPTSRTALKTAVDACISETDDGSCPIFAASNDNTGNPYGVIGTWDVSSVTSMSQSMCHLSFHPFSFCCLLSSLFF